METEITNFYEFVQWCFRSPGSTIITLLLISGVGYFILDLIKAFKKKG